MSDISNEDKVRDLDFDEGDRLGLGGAWDVAPFKGLTFGASSDGFVSNSGKVLEIRDLDALEDLVNFLNHDIVADIAATGGIDAERSFARVDGDELVLGIPHNNVISAKYGSFNGYNHEITLKGYGSLVGLGTTVTFDDIAPTNANDGTEQPIDDGYAGFVWQQAGVYNPTVGGNLGYAPASEPNTTFIGEMNGNTIDGYELSPGDPVTFRRQDGSPFDLLSVTFTAANKDDLPILVRALNAGGQVIGAKSFTIDRFVPRTSRSRTS